MFFTYGKRAASLYLSETAPFQMLRHEIFHSGLFWVRSLVEGKAGDKPMLDTGALYNDFDWEITER